MPWFARFIRRRKQESQLDAELQFHLEQRTADLIATGVEPAEARRRAMIEFGGVERAKEECRESRGTYFIESILQDIRYGFRTLHKSPGFTAVAVLTLALGLAASTAIFSIINGVLLQPLPYPHSTQLVTIELAVPQFARKFPLIPPNPAAYLAWSQQAKSLAGIGIVEVGGALNLTGSGEPALLNADAVTSNLFEVLGVKPLLGRDFSPDADHPGRNHEVILTNTLWRTRFHSEASIVGHAIALDGRPYTVIGVLPPSFHFPQGNQLMPVIGPTPTPDLFVPEVFPKSQPAADTGFGLAAIARLNPGVSRAQATAELNVILTRLFRSQSITPYPRAVMMPLRDMIVRSSRRGLWMLLAAVLAVLLIICVNLASLVLTRATAREHEAAIRSALGASRSRLLRQAVTETLLLGLLGGALGLVLAHWALWALLAFAPVSLPRLQNIRLDGAVLGFTLGISLLAGVLAGMLAALRIAQANPQDALRSTKPRGADRGTGLGAPELLVGLETALGTMLLIAAGLLLASFAKLERVPKGFAVEHILTVDLQLPAARYTRKRRREFWRRVLSATSALPGVDSSAVTDWLPLGGEIDDDPVNLPGDTRPVAERPFASYRCVSPAYFKVLGIPLLRGREFTWADSGTGAVVISAATADAVWPGRDPIGQKFDVSPSPALQVVGVVGDTRSVSLFKAPTAMVYQLCRGNATASLILRTRLRATAVAPELHRAIWRVDPGVAIPRIDTMGKIVSASLAPRRFETLLTSLFAAAALLLACLGIYGVVSYSVARHSHEIGVRIALGAPTSDLYRATLGQGLRPVVLGLLVGVGGALALGRLISGLLFGIRPYDPAMLVAAAAAVIATAVIACALPARRATRIDPMATLRQE